MGEDPSVAGYLRAFIGELLECSDDFDGDHRLGGVLRPGGAGFLPRAVGEHFQVVQFVDEAD